MPCDIHYHLIPGFVSSRPVAGDVITATEIANPEFLEVEEMAYTQMELFETFEKTQTIAEKIAQYGVKGLGDCELMVELIRPYLSSRADAKRTANEILDALNCNVTPSLTDLTSIKGVSKELASGILIALEFGRRKGEKTARSITSPNDIYRETYHFTHEEQEHFIVMALNGAHEILFTKCITTGIVNKTLAHPREVFSDAIKARATAIAIAHNHPSGTLEPSDDDISLTKRIRLAGDILGIKVLDHLIITDKSYYSFLEHGMLE